MLRVCNIDDKVVFEGYECDFIDFMKKIVVENEDYDFTIIGLPDAIEYLESYCSNLTLERDVVVTEPVFYELIPRKLFNVMEHVYGPGAKGMTLEERLPNKGACEDCGRREWILFPKISSAVRDGGKQYIECIHCGFHTHL